MRTAMKWIADFGLDDYIDALCSSCGQDLWLYDIRECKFFRQHGKNPMQVQIVKIIRKSAEKI